MKQLLSMYIVIICLISFNAITFSSDKQMGPIDTFVLKTDSLSCTKSISKYLMNYGQPESHFSPKEPIFITLDGALHTIHMPTNLKPFIVIIPDAQNIIDTNPDIFCAENIKNKISFESHNQSNRAIHTKLADRIIPIDHCTHVRNNGDSIDIVSIFFNKEFFSLLIPKLQINARKKTFDAIKQKRRQEFLSVPQNNSDSLEFNYEKRAEDEDSDIMHVSVPDYEFW